MSRICCGSRFLCFRSRRRNRPLFLFRLFKILAIRGQRYSHSVPEIWCLLSTLFIAAEKSVPFLNSLATSSAKTYSCAIKKPLIVTALTITVIKKFVNPSKSWHNRVHEKDSIGRRSCIARARERGVYKRDCHSKNKKIVADMKEALLPHKDGVAIAAPQIGVPLRFLSYRDMCLTRKRY